MRETPLGKPSQYALSYSPDMLCAVPRSDARNELGLGRDLPFRGADIWNAWEITWLNTAGKPMVATAEMAIDATSPNMIESKSLKLYLNSFTMTRFASPDEIAALIRKDLSQTAGSNVTVGIITADISTSGSVGKFPGACIDDLKIPTVPDQVDPGILRCVNDDVVTEELHSHLLRSNCPVTHQPDMGSVLIRYSGEKIDCAALLAYIVSYRLHNDFHEACVERMFLDIRNRCQPRSLTVYARYNRRGGLDINPFRTNTDETPDNLRLWRQ
jgi:7-cyano-7-deazaguanine reductase